MDKKSLRVKMKALAIARFIIENHAKILQQPWYNIEPMGEQIKNYALLINSLPASIFRADKPEVDKRRDAKWKRKNSGKEFLLVSRPR